MIKLVQNKTAATPKGPYISNGTERGQALPANIGEGSWSPTLQPPVEVINPKTQKVELISFQEWLKRLGTNNRGGT